MLSLTVCYLPTAHAETGKTVLLALETPEPTESATGRAQTKPKKSLKLVSWRSPIMHTLK